MRSNRRRDTAPELAVRKLLHARGRRFRVDFKAEPEVRTRADVAFTRVRLAVFIDGCFWHSCPLHGTTPASNMDYWLPKLAANAQRDAAATVALELRGWTVLRFWEHEPPTAVADEIEQAVVRLTQESRR